MGRVPVMAQSGDRFLADHGLESGDDLPRFDELRNTVLNRCNRHGLRLGEIVATCPSWNDLRLFELWKSGVSGSVLG